MDISDTGKGLDILIRCTPTQLDEWLSFSCWYSISKNLPDAKAALSVVGLRKSECFRWAYRLNVRMLTNEPDGCFCVPCSTLAVREYNADCVGPVSAKSEEDATFVSCKEVGKFVLDRWIDRYGVPFGTAVKKLSSSGVTVNEMKVLKLWDKMDSVFGMF